MNISKLRLLILLYVLLLSTVSIVQAQDALVAFGQADYLKAPSPQVLENFGGAMAVSGNTLVVGTPNDRDVDMTYGGAFVYVRGQDGNWALQAHLRGSNTEGGAGPAPPVPFLTPHTDGFGLAVAIDGNTIVVGAPHEDSAATGVNGNQADNSAGNAGAAYVFVRDGGGNWTQQAYLKASNTDSGDGFGGAVGISGNIIVVGAVGEASNATSINGNQADNSVQSAGAAYVFVRDGGGNWTQQAYLKSPDTPSAGTILPNPTYQPPGGFGASVAVDGNTVAVGAPYGYPGSTTVFTSVDDIWAIQGHFKVSTGDTFQSDAFGFSLALSDDTLLVGAPQKGDPPAIDPGNPIQPPGLPTPPPPLFNVSPDQSTATESTDYYYGYAEGRAYIFTRTGISWSQQAELKASNADVGDSFGHHVALDGDVAVISAPGESSSTIESATDNSAMSAGAAYVYGRANNVWQQVDYLKALNADERDSFGSSAAIVDTIVFVGAQYEGGLASMYDNDAVSSGAAYVFTLDATTSPPITGVVSGVAPSGTITDMSVNPTIQWNPVPGAQGYEIYLMQHEASYMTYPILAVSSAQCNPQCQIEGSSLSYSLLPNGNYSIYINPDPSRVSTWQGPYDFSINLPPLTAPTLLLPTNTNTGYPTINWTLDDTADSADRFQIYLAVPTNLMVPIASENVPRELACGSAESTDCSWEVLNFLENGAYTLYMTSYRGNEVAIGGNIPDAPGWVTQDFEIINTAPLPTAPTDLTIEEVDGQVQLTWTASQNTTRYEIWAGVFNNGFHYQIGGVPPTPPFLPPSNRSVSAEAFGCAGGGTCTHVLPIVHPDFSYGVYNWNLSSLGPGGRMENGLGGWVVGPTLIVEETNSLKVQAIEGE